MAWAASKWRALAADDQIAISVGDEPGEIRLTRDAGIHDNETARWGVKPREHPFQRLDLRGIAGKGL